jgi:hypothetical protein
MSARRVALLLLVLGSACGRTHLLPPSRDGGPRPPVDAGGAPDGAAPQTCGPFNRCGGEITGDWTVESVCLPEAAVPGCPGSRVGFERVVPQGSFAFGADHRYSSRLALSGALVLTIPISCAAQQAGVPPGLLNCLLLGAALRMASPPAGAGIASAGCTGVEVCRCTLGITGQPQSVTGTYSTRGTSLVLEGSGQPQTLDYCVSDPTLLIKTSVPVPLMGAGTLDGEMVLRRSR